MHSPTPFVAGTIVGPVQLRILRRALARGLHPAGSARRAAHEPPPPGWRANHPEAHDLFAPARQVSILRMGTTPPAAPPQGRLWSDPGTCEPGGVPPGWLLG